MHECKGKDKVLFEREKTYHIFFIMSVPDLGRKHARRKTKNVYGIKFEVGLRAKQLLTVENKPPLDCPSDLRSESKMDNFSNFQ